MSDRNPQNLDTAGAALRMRRAAARDRAATPQVIAFGDTPTLADAARSGAPQGAKVIEARTFEDFAVAYLRSGADTVVCQMVMDWSDGYEVATFLAENRFDGRLVVINTHDRTYRVAASEIAGLRVRFQVTVFNAIPDDDILRKALD